MGSRVTSDCPLIIETMDEEDIITLYEDGMNIEDIADELGLCNTTVLRVLEEAGIFDEY